MPKSGIDYLKFRTQSTHFQVMEAIRPHLYAPDCLSIGPDLPGKDGWKVRRNLMIEDLLVASMDYGGDSQRGWLRFEMTGKGCEWVRDWKGVAGLVGGLDSADLRRVDLAVDTYDGSVTHEKVMAAYEAGSFKREGGGRNPKLKKVESSEVTDGRTIYIGARTSSRFLRCYEKGWEQVAKVGLPEQFKKLGLVIDFENGQGPVRVADYYRVEAEFKAVDGAVLPWTMLSDPDPYFAGAAPFCASLVEVAPKRIQTMPSEFDAKASLAASMEHCRTAYGGLLRSLLEIYGDTADVKARLFDELSGDKPSERLIKTGIYLVNHVE